MDEARFGLKVSRWRCWCPRGHRPPWQVEDRYEWLWLYAAVEPATGESFCLYMPTLDGLHFEVFLQKLREAYPEEEIVLVLPAFRTHMPKHVCNFTAQSAFSEQQASKSDAHVVTHTMFIANSVI